jgi:hypothetical protein
MSSMTQIMSPFRRESGIFNTPGRNDLRAMRLASTNDLTVSVQMNREVFHQISVAVAHGH